jgi:aryl-alcohol dehydrogenase
MQVHAAVVNAARERFSIELLELEEPRDDEVLVQVTAAGLSRIDLLARDQRMRVPLPAVLGSEAVGRVERIGAKVMSLAPGDRVVFVRGNAGSNLFDRRISQFRSTDITPLHRFREPIAESSFGQCCLATHVTTQERNLVKVPDDDTSISVLAAVGGDVQVGASAVMDTLRLRPGSSIAIFGVGAAGLSAVMAAHLVGCHPIIAVDIKASRLDLAEQFGATHTLDPDGLDAVATIWAVATGGVECAIDTTGDPSVVGQVVECVTPGGICVLAGPGPLDAEASLRLRLLLQHRTLVGNPCGSGEPMQFLPRLLGLHRRALFPLERLITEFPLDDINEAADTLLSGAAVKPVLVMP